MLDGQVHSGEEHHDGGVCAGRVAVERALGLYLVEPSIVEYLFVQKLKHILGIALLFSCAWHVWLEHGRDRGRSAGAGPILEHAQDSQHG